MKVNKVGWRRIKVCEVKGMVMKMIMIIVLVGRVGC